MFNRIFPTVLDNRFGGHRAALWFLGLLLLLRAVMSANSVFNGYDVVRFADGVPLDSFPPQAVVAVLSLFALLALSHLIIVLVGVVVLVRYRAMVPFIFLILLAHHLAGRLLLVAMPVAQEAGRSPGFLINLALASLMLAGLLLSLKARRPSHQA